MPVWLEITRSCSWKMALSVHFYFDTFTNTYLLIFTLTPMAMDNLGGIYSHQQALIIDFYLLLLKTQFAYSHFSQTFSMLSKHL